MPRRRARIAGGEAPAGAVGLEAAHRGCQRSRSPRRSPRHRPAAPCRPGRQEHRAVGGALLDRLGAEGGGAPDQAERPGPAGRRQVGGSHRTESRSRRRPRFRRVVVRAGRAPRRRGGAGRGRRSPRRRTARRPAGDRRAPARPRRGGGRTPKPPASRSVGTPRSLLGRPSPQRPVGPHVGRAGGGGPQVVTHSELPAQPHRLRHPGQERSAPRRSGSDRGPQLASRSGTPRGRPRRRPAACPSRPQRGR